MPTKSKLHTLPDAIKDELIEKCLRLEPLRSITEWLNNHHGITVSKSAVFRLYTAFRAKFCPLIELGMPIEEIIKHRLQIEALGVEQVKQQILDKLTEKNGSIVSYLDKKESSK